ncbi:putative ubiquinone biosynthesis protein UbiB [Planctomycetes bacterium Poly30]|uniref:Putative ubiquinone biosynthesis protein UbiB n=1 Tax=Saltatorellus ferox TaxID=2528018 RepID=A0A518EZ98_9BACT|nr:putative ubiquinone biosynthesis protein UbiB [Planctomycetes bacterium Poly30]
MKSLRTLRQAAAIVPIAMGRGKGRSRQALAERLGPLRGASTKVAQLLSARDGEDAGRALEPLPLARLLPVMRAAAPTLLGDGATIGAQGRRASLGQVHRAELSDGRDAAVKVLLPGVESDLRSDLGLMGWVGRRAGRRLRQRFDGVAVDDWIAALGDELLAELDYRAEAEAQGRYGRAVSSLPHAVVPAVIVAGDEVLISTWEGGSALADAVAWEPDKRAQLGEALTGAILHPMLTDGLVHGDLHPGNVAFREDRGGEIVLYDFGATREISLPARQAWRALLRGEVPAWDALLTLGFDAERLAPLRDRLDALAALLFAPFRERNATQIDGAERRARADALLGEHRMVPRLAAPTSAIPMIRTLSGLFTILGHLAAPMELWRVFDGADAPAPALPTRAPGKHVAPALPARLLVRSFGEDGRGVEIRLPFETLPDLEDLLPDSAREPIERSGVDLGALAREAFARGPIPQTLFDDVVEGRRVELRVIEA